MDLSQPAQSAPLPPSATPVRPHNGLGVAALVIGVASVVAGVSFVLFPLALVGGLVGLILGIIALTRGRSRGATNTGQAIAGVVCCALALVISIDLSVRVGTWAARNSDVFARFDKCTAQAANRADVATCISRFANQVRS
jgi:membrane-bound ClpP family serine protease